MDAAFTLTRLMDELAALSEGGDFAGAEELLSSSLSLFPQHEPFLHLQLGRLYIRWNKLTSALNHLGRAAELSRDEILIAQVVEEVRVARTRQTGQTP